MSEQLKTNELTFQKLFEILRRSLVRILVYGLVLAILGGGITAIAIFADRNSAEYTAIIEYNYIGAESGLDPLGKQLDTNRIKSSVLINQTLKKMGITENVTEYTQAIRDNISISGYVSNQTAMDLAQDMMSGYFPTRYTITLEENSKIPFSRTQYQTFLNELIDTYKGYFKDSYNYGKVLSLSIADEALAATSDYYDLCIDYELAIDKLVRELNAIEGNIKNVSKNLVSNIEVLKSGELFNIKSYIVGKNVSKKNAPLTLFENLSLRSQEYLESSAMYGELADAQLSAVKEYNNNSSKQTTDGNLIDIVVTASEYYDKMVENYSNYILKQSSFQLQADNIAKQIEKVTDADPASEQERTHVEDSLLAFDKSIRKRLASVNSELATYSNQMLDNNGVKTAMPATRTHEFDYFLILIVAFVCGFVGCVTAVIVTEIKVKRNLAKHDKASNQNT